MSVVCSGCGKPATWSSWFWAWVCPAGDIVSEQTGRVIGSMVEDPNVEPPPTYAWRQPGQPWPEDTEVADG